MDYEETRVKRIIPPESFLIAASSSDCEKCGGSRLLEVQDGRRSICNVCSKDLLKKMFTFNGVGSFDGVRLSAFDLNYFEDDVITRQRTVVLNNSKIYSEYLSKNTQEQFPGYLQVYYSGEHASGKTYLAVVMCKYMIIQGMSAYYVKHLDINDLSPKEVETLKRYDLVVIDDYIPDGTLNHKNQRVLNNLLDSRMLSGKMTCIFSSTPIDIAVADSEACISSKLRRFTLCKQEIAKGGNG